MKWVDDAAKANRARKEAEAAEAVATVEDGDAGSDLETVVPGQDEAPAPLGTDETAGDETVDEAEMPIG